MTQTARRIIEEVLALPKEEIEEVIEAILERLHPASDPAIELEPDLHDRVAKRIAEIQDGRVETIDWEAVKAEGRKKLDKINT